MACAHSAGMWHCSGSRQAGRPGHQRRRNEMAAAGDSGRLLCVTGASGFIGSWLVRCLLDRGYTVHATVKNLRK